MPTERTLILVKPDAFGRGLTGEIILRFERKGLRLVALRQMTMDVELAQRHYAEHEGKPFYGELVDFITSGPLVAMVLEGASAVEAARQVIGATDPLEAAPGSIRGDFAIEVGQNMVHGSDSPESAAREVGLFFPHLADGRPLILASRSPQRRLILEQLGIPFTVVVPEVDELEQGPAEEVAITNATRKAEVVASQRPDELVLGADTVVCLEGRTYGKAAGETEARQTLTALSGRRHEVIGGLCLIEGGRARTASATTRVRFRPLEDRLIAWYLESEEWRDRAGAYAIQGRGAALVEGIEGDFLNVVGLPVATLLALAPDLLS